MAMLSSSNGLQISSDSLGGNSRTTMVANIGPASYNYDETLTTLRSAVFHQFCVLTVCLHMSPRSSAAIFICMAFKFYNVSVCLLLHL